MRKVNEDDRPASGENIDEEIESFTGSEEEQDAFIEDISKATRDMIEANRLDNVGFERSANSVLDYKYERCKEKMDAIPLTNLVEKLKEVAGLMPMLRKFQERQIEQDAFFYRWEQTFAENYLLKVDMDIDFGKFQLEMEDRLKRRLDTYDIKMEAMLDSLATKQYVDNGLEKKAAANHMGYLLKEIADFRESLSPLFERKFILTSLINKVLQH